MLIGSFRLEALEPLVQDLWAATRKLRKFTAVLFLKS